MKISLIFLLIAAIFAVEPSLAQQKTTTSGASTTPDLYKTSKTLVQLLQDGWELKGGDISSFQGVDMFLSKGRDVAVCVGTDTDPKSHQKTADTIFMTCATTIRP